MVPPICGNSHICKDRGSFICHRIGICQCFLRPRAQIFPLAALRVLVGRLIRVLWAGLDGRILHGLRLGLGFDWMSNALSKQLPVYTRSDNLCPKENL